MTLTESVPHAPRRLVLVDFDWRDVDLLPELFSRPELSIRLVAGERPHDIGLRVAELCDLPRTVDLADLTREIFDLALVSERSPRRTQVEGLLLALGTPCVTPHAFLEGAATGEPHIPAIEAPLAMHAAALETTLGGGDFDAIIEHALSDVGEDAPTAPLPMRPTGRVGVQAPRLDEFPSLEDRQALERALLSLVEGTGASGAVLHAGRPNEIRVVAQVGGADALLDGLIGLALELNTPQVITHVTGPHEGKAWGAWPFRTTRTRGVLAASGIDPAEGWTMWEKTLEDLRTTWDERDRAQAAPAFPLMPAEPRGWLDPETFRTRLQLAVDRNGRDALAFAVHRLSLDEGDTVGAADRFALALPDQLRDTDCICRPSPKVVLMLSTTLGPAFDPVRRRLALQWEEVHRLLGATAAPILKRSAELTGPADVDGFLATVNGWLSAP